jgi:hypothetical protein
MTTITKKCLECRNKFEPKRSDAKYCSANCKVKAHYHRDKTKLTLNQEIKEVFYIDEYEAVLKELGVRSEDLPLILYCFYRRNLKSDKTIQNVVDYTYAVWQNGLQIMKKNTYLEFEDLFLSGKMEVKPSKNMVEDDLI